MFRNRIKSQLGKIKAPAGRQAPSIATIPTGFMLCPAALMTGGAHMALARTSLYRLAYERARRTAVPRYLRGLHSVN